MKKLLFLLLLSITCFGQVVPPDATPLENIQITNNTTSTTATKVSVQENNGVLNSMAVESLPISIAPHPINYTASTPTLGAHLIGIDNKIGTIVQTTAGVFNRINFTGDPTTITAGTFYLTSATSKGTAAAASPAPLVNDDNQKKYFAQDLIGIPFAALTKFPAGTYAGQITVRVSPNSAQQRYTVELYKTNNGGTPIASGVTGAPVGSLGVTVVAILDSGLINLADNALTGIPISGTVASELTINTGERIRYHVSAEKVGTASANITMEVFYGSDYNSHIDVPVTFNTSLQQAYDNSSVVPQIVTNSAFGAVTVKRGSGADTDNILAGQNGAGANTFSVKGSGAITGTSLNATNLTANNVSKSSATGFVDSSITDSGTGAGGIVNINNFIGGTVTRVLPSGQTSIGQTFNVTGTDATSALINRNTHNLNEDGFVLSGNRSFVEYVNVNNKSTNQPSFTLIGLNTATFQNGSGTLGNLTSIKTGFSGSGTGWVNTIYLIDTNSSPILNTFPVTNFVGFNMPFTPQNNVTNAYGVRIGELYGSTASRAFESSVSAGAGKFNIYSQGTANNYFKGKILVDATDNGVDIIRANGSVLATGYKVTGTTGFLKSDGTNETALTSSGGNIGIGASPISKLHVFANLQSNTISVANSGGYFAGGDVGVAFGQYASAPNGAWMQSMRFNDVAFNLSVNPLGGNVLIGKQADSSDGVLQVNGAVSASPATLSTQLVTKAQLDAAAGTSGSYTPTLTNTLNASSPTLDTAVYTKIGNIVTVTIGVAFTVTTGGSNSVISITLPVNRTPTTTKLSGSLTGTLQSSSSYYSGIFQTVNNTTEVKMFLIPITAGVNVATGTFSYSII